jgi:uncharacterized protein (DUF885 family)
MGAWKNERLAGEQSMKRALPALALPFLVLVAPAAGPRPGPSEDQKLAAFFKNYLDQELKQRPLEATRLGDHRFDHLLDDVSPKARKKWAERYRATLADLPKKIQHGKLSRGGQIDYEIFKHHLTRELWLAENTRPFEEDPRIYNDYLTECTYLLLTQSTLPQARNVQNCAARLAYVPRIIAAAKASLRAPPRVFVETAIRQNRGAIAYYERGIFELAGETAALSDLKPAAAKAVVALKEYQVFLEKTLLPRAKGEWRIGKEKFARKLELELDAGQTAEQVLRDAEAELLRVEREMYVVARQLWSKTQPGKALPPDDQTGRRETVRIVLAKLNQEHGEAKHLVRDARTSAERIKKFIAAKDILRLPRPDNCKIVEMPEFQRGNTVAYLNPAPPLDPKASSYYAISPPPKHWDARTAESFLQEYNKYMLQILTIHEAYPGHYVQLEYSNRHPSLIRRVLSSGVFAEGWAVYTEQMMLDQGYGDGDLAMRLNQLKWYLRAVANAILDHKMHCTGMTDAEALAFLMNRAYQAEGEAVGKIIRAKQSSCQLSTYFVGRMAFYTLRQKVQRELGEKFELGRYHEAVLDHGTLPVKYLPELVRARLKRPR